MGLRNVERFDFGSDAVPNLFDQEDTLSAAGGARRPAVHTPTPARTQAYPATLEGHRAERAGESQAGWGDTMGREPHPRAAASRAGDRAAVWRGRAGAVSAQEPRPPGAAPGEGVRLPGRPTAPARD
jgi:hypothetical protein